MVACAAVAYVLRKHWQIISGHQLLPKSRVRQETKYPSRICRFQECLWWVSISGSRSQAWVFRRKSASFSSFPTSIEQCVRVNGSNSNTQYLTLSQWEAAHWAPPPPLPVHFQIYVRPGNASICHSGSRPDNGSKTSKFGFFAHVIMLVVLQSRSTLHLG